MSFHDPQATTKRWRFPPLGVLVLGSLYLVFAFRLLLHELRTFGEIDYNWPNHGVFGEWDLLWQKLLVILLAGFLSACCLAVPGSKAGRRWLTLFLGLLLAAIFAHDGQYSFLQYKFATGNLPPPGVIWNIFKDHFWSPEMLIFIGILIAHAWCFYLSASARRHFRVRTIDQERATSSRVQ